MTITKKRQNIKGYNKKLNSDMLLYATGITDKQRGLILNGLKNEYEEKLMSFLSKANLDINSFKALIENDLKETLEKAINDVSETNKKQIIEINEIKDIVDNKFKTILGDIKTSNILEIIKKKATPVKGIDYNDGKKGDKGEDAIVDYKTIIDTVFASVYDKTIDKISGDYIVNELEKREGDKRLDVKAVKGLTELIKHNSKKSGGKTTVVQSIQTYLKYLQDVNIVDREDGDTLVYNKALDKWESKAPTNTGSGDMLKATYDTTDNGIVDNAEKVNGLTIETAVPLNAVFTDTVYDDTAIQNEVDSNTAHSHSHTNKSTLDKFGENGNGDPTYNGTKVDTTIAQRDVYDGLDSTDNTVSLSAKQGKVLKDKQDTQQTEININTNKVSADSSINTHSDVDTTGQADGKTLTYNGSTDKWEPQTPATGVTDHGLLLGLGDDDHAQYHNNARGDARYYKKPEVDTALDGKSDTGHNHTASDITDFDTGVSNNTDVSANKTKLAGIENNATADQTDAEIKTAYENNADTNAFTDAEKTKLGNVNVNAEVNVNANWNATSGDEEILNKPTIPNSLDDLSGTLDDIPNGTTYVKSENNFTDAEKTKLGNISGTNTGDQVGDGVTITGAGTVVDPFVSAGGGGISDWDSTKTYVINDLVSKDGAIYKSITASNLNNNPAELTSSGGNVSSLTDNGYISTSNYYWYGIDWAYDGTKLYGIKGDGKFYKISVTSSFDISTGSLGSGFSISGIINPTGIKFVDDGNQAFISADNSDWELHKVSMVTPYDLENAVLEQTVTLDVRYGLSASNDGIHIIADSNNTVGKINSFTLSTAFDLSTAVLTSSYDFGGLLTAGNRTSDCGKWIVIGDDTYIRSFTLSTDWDISTASNEIDKSVSGDQNFGLALTGKNELTIGSEDYLRNWKFGTEYSNCSLWEKITN